MYFRSFWGGKYKGNLKCASYVISSKSTIAIFYPIRPCNESLNECKLLFMTVVCHSFKLM